MLNSSKVTLTDELNQAAFQAALTAIRSNQLSQAHRLLLQALQADPLNIQILLLLGWTAQNSASAAYYFQLLLEQHPDNPLACEILQRVSNKPSAEEHKSGSNIYATKQLIAKVIAYLEKPVAEGKKTGRETRLVEGQAAGRKIKSVVIQSTSKKARQMGIPQNFRIPLVYLAALTVAEAITTLANPQVGLILHGLLLVILILHAALFARRGQQKFLITLTLAPLIRLMSLSIPLLNFPVIYWYAVIGLPLFLAAFMALRMTGFDAVRVGLNGRKLPWQLLVGATGLGLGYVEYIILRPAPLVEALTWKQILLPALILLLFTGLLEEIIFRGLIQRGAAGTIGRYGLVYVAALFAVLHLGYRSIWDVVFVFVVALFFGLVVARTGSLLGVTLSHGLTNVALYLIIPFLMNASTNPIGAIPQTITDTTSSPILWEIPDINARQISLDEGSRWVHHKDAQLDLYETKKSQSLDWVYVEGKGMKTDENWRAGNSEYQMYILEDNTPLNLVMPIRYIARSGIVQQI